MKTSIEVRDELLLELNRNIELVLKGHLPEKCITKNWIIEVTRI